MTCGIWAADLRRQLRRQEWVHNAFMADKLRASGRIEKDFV